MGWAVRVCWLGRRDLGRPTTIFHILTQRHNGYSRSIHILPLHILFNSSLHHDSSLHLAQQLPPPILHRHSHPTDYSPHRTDPDHTTQQPRQTSMHIPLCSRRRRRRKGRSIHHREVFISGRPAISIQHESSITQSMIHRVRPSPVRHTLTFRNSIPKHIGFTHNIEPTGSVTL